MGVNEWYLNPGMESSNPDGANVKRIVRNTKDMTGRWIWGMDIWKQRHRHIDRKENGMLEQILDSDNMNRAYLRVKRNHGSGGVDGMSVDELGEYLAAHKDEILQAILDGRYRPNPVLRVEIPKDGGKKRPLGIPTVTS